jgi:hypothetical protein
MSNPEDEEALLSWNTGLEMVVKKEGEQAESMFVLHDRAAKVADKYNDYIMIPSIVLQTVTGFLSATNGLVPPLALGAISVFTGILSTLISYYRFSAKAEGHRVVALLYLKLYKLVEVELALPIAQRLPASKLLEDVRKKISHIQEIAPDIPDGVIKEYKARFKDITSAKPIIANGIDEIMVFTKEVKEVKVSN